MKTCSRSQKSKEKLQLSSMYGSGREKSTAKFHHGPAACAGVLLSLAVKHCYVPVGSGLHFAHVTAGLGSKECLEVGTTIQPRNHLI